jgi:hypothetical protein
MVDPVKDEESNGFSGASCSKSIVTSICLRRHPVFDVQSEGAGTNDPK